MFEALIREKEEQAIVIQEKNTEILRLKDIIRLLEINAENKDKIWMMHCQIKPWKLYNKLF